MNQFAFLMAGNSTEGLDIVTQYQLRGFHPDITKPEEVMSLEEFSILFRKANAVGGVRGDLASKLKELGMAGSEADAYNMGNRRLTQEECDTYFDRAQQIEKPFTEEEKTFLRTGIAPDALLERKIAAMKITDEDCLNEYMIAVNASCGDGPEAVGAFMGSGKTAIGSILEIADFFIGKRQDFQLHRAILGVPGLAEPKKAQGGSEEAVHAAAMASAEDREEKRKLHLKQKAAFAKQVGAVLKTGNLVGLMIQDYTTGQKHYRTIRAIDGDRVTLMDSNGEGFETTESIDEIFRRTKAGTLVELTWFAPLEKKETLLEKLPELDFAGGQFALKKGMYPSLEELHNLAHRKGVLCRYPDDVMNMAVYLPKVPVYPAS